MYIVKGKRWKYGVLYFIFDWPSLTLGFGWWKDYKHSFYVDIGPFKFLTYIERKKNNG